MLYNIYHDESKEEAYWHVFLFVPLNQRIEIHERLQEARLNTNCKKSRLSFKKLKNGPSIHCAKVWLSILSSSFQQRQKNRMEPFLNGINDRDHLRKRSVSHCDQFSQPPKCKIAIFRQANKHSDMSGHLDELSKIETTFRMAIQGAAHYLFSEENPLIVRNVFIDGEKHYKREHRREFDKNKIICKLESRFRKHCMFHQDCYIQGEQLDPIEREFLDLADIVLGAFRLGTLRQSIEDCKTNKERENYILCKYISCVIEKLQKGKARMANSRFEGFGSFSSAYISDFNDLIFEDMIHDFQKKPSPVIPTLPF